MVFYDVEWLFLVVPWGCLRFVIVVYPDHIHLLFLESVASDLGLYYVFICPTKRTLV